MNKIILSTFAFLFSIFGSLIAQNSSNSIEENNSVWLEMMQDPNANFFATQAVFEEYWKNRIIKPGDGWKVFKRWEAFMESRVNGDGMKPAPGYVLQQYQQMMLSGSPLSSASGTWTNIGPISLPSNSSGQPNGIGRVNDVAFHPSNSNIIFVGSPSGGLWKTTNGGSSWTALTDNLPTLGVSSIVIDTANTNIMYMGTGDRDAGDAPGLGVYKSTDGGVTWNASTAGIGSRLVSKIIINKSNSSILLAATQNGIYKTTNGGQTWIKKTTGNINFKDIVYKPNNYNIVYATSYYPGVAFYRSLNGGDSWTQISTGISSVGDRMVIGVSAAATNTIYLVAGGSSGLVAVYKSTNGGSSFSTTATSPNILGRNSSGSDNASQAWYDLTIAVDPTNANTLYVGGINTWKSVNGGTSWSLNSHWVGNGAPVVHADIHVLKFSPSGVLYNGCDGGLYKTSNGGTTWTDISSGLAISQIYKIGQSASDGNLLIAGFQDNGTASVSGTAWTTVIGGDGMECAIDPTTTNYQYGELYYGDIRRSVNGGYFSTIADNGSNGINESGGWVTPYCLQEGQSGTMFIGYKNVWRSTNIKAANSSSVSWTKIGNWGSSSNIKVIENSPADNGIIYASRSSQIYRTDNANSSSPTWVTISSPGGTITDIEAHPTNPNIVYATGGNNIYKSTNKGSSWVSISGNLPNVSINCLVYDTSSNEGIYVGTDIGVFYKDANLTNWINFSSGMPVAAEVVELEIYYSSVASQSKIRAATYGRGVWSSDLYLNPNSPPIADFNANSTTTCTGGTIVFTDASAPNPTSWQWSVVPSTVTFVNSTSASSQNPEIQFNAVGTYSVKLIVTNANGSDTLTKSNYITVSAPYSTPVTENFESFVVATGGPGTWAHGWTYSNTGNFYWRANNGNTPSANTGPSIDHTLGTGSGIYIYTEASQPAVQGEVANLISPCMTLPSSGNYGLSFWYHMFGSNITGLHVDIYTNGTWINDIYTLTGPQQTSYSSSWQQANISLSSYLGNTIKVRFRVIRGANYMGDVALDDIKISPITNAPTANFASSQTTTCQGGALSFINLSIGNPTAWNWSFSPSSVTYINNTSDSSQNPQVKFLSTGNYTVTLIASNVNGADTIVKNNYITVNSAVSVPNNENFESFTVGTPGSFQNGWSTNNNGNFPWYVNSGTTPSNYTGPSVDHTFGTSAGKYLYTEASGNNMSGNTAILLSPCYNFINASTARVSFWYHMYGQSITALRMDVFYNGAWVNNVKVINGQQQNSNSAAWLKTTVNLDSYVGGSIRFRFRVVHPGDYRCDVAIDDISVFEAIPPVNDDPCGAISLNVGNTCTYTITTNENATTTQGVQVPSCGGTIYEDVWYKAVVPASGGIIIDAEQVPANFADGVVAAYKGSCNSLILVGCNDDYQGSGNMPHLVITNQTPGDTIFIRFWKYGGGTGQFKLCLTEPPHFVLSPSTISVPYNGGSTNISVSASPNITWSVSDNASWLTLSPTTGTGNGTITVNYSANANGSRNATITGIANGLPNRVVTFQQLGYVAASFTSSSQMICNGSSVTFTNNSTNANSYIWYVNGIQQSTSTNFIHTFSSDGNFTVKLKAIGANFTDSSSMNIFVQSMNNPFAGVDTSLCEGGNINLNPDVSIGLVSCSSNCNIPSNCNSHSNNDSQEYIIKVDIDGVSNFSAKSGSGFQDFSDRILMPIIKDSTYNLTVTAHTAGNWLEYVDVYIDWNRNGLFDEPAISLGSATFVGDHDFYGFITVPSNVQIGTTRMRVIMKYNSAIANGCINSYGYGETEDYALEILSVDTLSHSWTGPASFISNLINPSINNIGVSQSGTYTLSVNNAFGCIATDDKMVTVLPLPTVTFASVNDVCISASPFALTQGSPSGGTYSGTGVSNGIFNPGTAGVGTHSIVYSYTNATGCSDTAMQTIQVNPLPSVSFTGLPSSLCINSNNVSLTGNPSGGLFKGDGIVMQNQFNPTLAGAGTHDVKYVYTDNNSCTDSTINSVTVYSLPVVFAGNDTTITYGSTANLHATVSNLVGNASYSWSPTNMLVNPNSANTATVDLYSSIQFNLLVSDATTSCSDSDFVQVNISGGPLVLSVSASPDTICDGDSAQLLALGSGGVATLSYSWTSSPSGFTSTLSNPKVSPNQNTWYYVVVTDGNTSISDSIFVYVRTLPTVNFNVASNVCEDADTVYMTAISPTGGIFVGNGVVGNAFIPQLVGVGVYPITYYYTDNNGCTNSISKNITVNALPIITMTSLSPICNTTPVFNLTNASPYGGTYSGDGVVGMQYNPLIAGIGSHYIKYTFTDQNQCTNTDSISIVVNSAPIANAGADQQISNGSIANLIGSATGGTGSYSYLWSPSSMVTNPNISNPTTISLTSSQIYQLNVVDNSTSCTDSDQVIITVIGGSVSAMVQVAQSPICKGDSVILLAIGSGGSGNYTYSWSSSPAYFSSNLQSPKVSPTATTVFIVMISDGNDSASAAQFVIVDEIPTGSLPSDTGLCSNSQIMLDAGGGYASYQWSNGMSGQQINIDGSTLPLGVTNFYVNITNANGCSITDSTSVDVTLAPANFLGNDTSICEQANITLDAGANMISYLWNTGDTTQTIVVNGSMGQGNYQYWVNVVDQYKCSGTDTINVDVVYCNSIINLDDNYQVKVYPNPATDLLKVEITGVKSDNLDLMIFDMQGKLVFLSKVAVKSEHFLTSININNLAKGFYTLKIQGQNVYNIQKLIIQ